MTRPETKLTIELTKSPPSVPARNGTASIMGTTFKSWKISRPRAIFPCLLSTSPLLWYRSMIIAVDEWATRKPIKSATLNEKPTAIMTPRTATVVITSWSIPPISTIFFIASRFFSDISRPMVNISRITPSSASIDTSDSAIRPRPNGPTIIPVKKYPMIKGSLNFRPISSTTRAQANTTTSAEINATSSSIKRPR